MAVPPNLRTDWTDNTGQLLTADALNSLGTAGNTAISPDSRAQIKTGTLTVPVIDNGGNIYDVRAYGAIGNNVADDTAAIQAAMDAAMNSTYRTGTVYIPGGIFRISTTLRFYRSDNGQHYVSLKGAGVTGTKLLWTGSNSLTMIKTWQNKNTQMSDFLMTNNNATFGVPSTRGTSVGMYMGNYGGFSLGTNGQVMTKIYAQGFDIGFQCGGINEGIGSGNEAAGEIVWNNCQAESCNYGWYCTAANTLDLQWIEVQTLFCQYGIRSFSGASLNIWGGGFSHNGNDIWFAGGGSFKISGVRAESTGAGNNNGRFALINTTTAHSGCIIDCCTIADPDPDTPGHDGIMIEGGDGSDLSIIDCLIRGGGVAMNSEVSPSSNSLFMRGVVLNDTVPFRNTGGTRDRLRYDIRGVTRSIDGALTKRPFDDEVGVMVAGVRTPLLHSKGLGAATLQNIRMMSGISRTNLKANNLAGSATFAGAATKSVVFGTPEVQSLIATGASSGTLTLSLDGMATTTALARNSSNGQVQAALNLLPNIGTSGTVVTGGPLPNSAVTITFTGPLVGGGSLSLLVADSTLLVGGTAVVTQTTDGTGSPPEPDATYTVAVTGNVNEVFWVTSKGNNGFTINSSNATSTAIVDWHLIR